MDIKTALRHDYRKTWEAFSRHTNTVHKLAGSNTRTELDNAALEAEIRKADLALAAHKEARDRLAAAMVPALAGPAKAGSERSSWAACHGIPRAASKAAVA